MIIPRAFAHAFLNLHVGIEKNTSMSFQQMDKHLDRKGPGVETLTDFRYFDNLGSFGGGG